LLAAVALLLVVTLAVFAIFNLIPRAAGLSPDDLASRYVGKTVGADQIHDVAVKLARRTQGIKKVDDRLDELRN